MRLLQNLDLEVDLIFLQLLFVKLKAVKQSIASASKIYSINNLKCC